MTPALSIRNLSKSYDGVPAVRALTLDIAPGEIFGLLGPNGAGKSTTINMVAGVTRIGSGMIKVFGHDVMRDYRLTRRAVGVMHQEIVIDNFFTIAEALRIHPGYYGVPDDPVWRQMLIERLGLGPHLHKFMVKLSGGLKRRFMIAKALIHKPSLLILDEPTAGVDVELRHALWDFVREINTQGTTILLTTHYLEEAEQMCGRIAIMQNGELVALDHTRQLLASLGDREISITLQRPLQELPPPLAALGGRLSADGLRLTFSLPADGDAGQILAGFCRCNIDVADIETRRASLEEVFLRMTGVGRTTRRSS